MSASQPPTQQPVQEQPSAPIGVVKNLSATAIVAAEAAKNSGPEAAPAAPQPPFEGLDPDYVLPVLGALGTADCHMGNCFFFVPQVLGVAERIAEAEDIIRFHQIETRCPESSHRGSPPEYGAADK